MISFVILHYKNIYDTLECISSIRKNMISESYSIIVVDNNTLSDSEYKKLKEVCSDVIKLNKNLGFAKGNNMGCNYAIKKYNPDFICVLNNDTLILNNKFLEEIENKYKETKFDILGPKIITEDGDSVNPFYAYSTLKEINEKIAYHQKLINIYQNSVLRYMLKVYIKVKKIFVPKKRLMNGEKSMYDVALHGCCLIFSKKYYKKFKDVFYEKTFLYHEEEFLDYRRRNNHLITYYDSDLEIFHKEGSSLNETFKNNSDYEKLIFKNKEIIKSLTILKNVIENKIDI